MRLSKAHPTASPDQAKRGPGQGRLRPGVTAITAPLADLGGGSRDHGGRAVAFGAKFVGNDHGLARQNGDPHVFLESLDIRGNRFKLANETPKDPIVARD